MWNRHVADSVRLDDTWLLGGDQNVSGLWEGRCGRHQNPISINGRSYGQVGSGNLPALIILILIGSITFGIINALMGSWHMKMWSMKGGRSLISVRLSPIPRTDVLVPQHPHPPVSFPRIPLSFPV
jgi:hypothetical protein